MMTTNRVITRSTAAATDQGFLEARLYEHNCAQIEQDDGQIFAFVVRNELQEIVAGISGWTWAHACEIRDLWVHPSLRVQGYGERLLAAAEQEAQHRGCKIILLASYSFQAPEFYQKHGYELALQLNDFPPGHQYSFLVKRFAETERD
jgi:GNAT superfamily N-acetyltransferase